MYKLVDENPKGVEHPLMENLLNELAHRLFTVCAIFIEYPYVQY